MSNKYSDSLTPVLTKTKVSAKKDVEVVNPKLLTYSRGSEDSTDQDSCGDDCGCDSMCMQWQKMVYGYSIDASKENASESRSSKEKTPKFHHVLPNQLIKSVHDGIMSVRMNDSNGRPLIAVAIRFNGDSFSYPIIIWNGKPLYPFFDSSQYYDAYVQRVGVSSTRTYGDYINGFMITSFFGDPKLLNAKIQDEALDYSTEKEMLLSYGC